MGSNLRIAFIVHSLRSDWNNGNAHFLRGLIRAVDRLGHQVTTFEPEKEWSIENLRAETAGRRALQRFAQIYPDIDLHTYTAGEGEDLWLERLRDTDIVVLHEWNPPALAQTLLSVRKKVGYKLLFHDTHHRASSSPEQIERFGLRAFDGIIAFGRALEAIYRERFGVRSVWTLHEAADTTVFCPYPEIHREDRIVWIGNWGDGERSLELQRYLLQPAAELQAFAETVVYGVRYPDDALVGLRKAHVRYAGYLANLEAPEIYARSRATVHVPRQQYTAAMSGIPTIRVFEALACGIPLVSAPWEDTEKLFREGDFMWANNGREMTAALRFLVRNPNAADALAARGRETVLARHTCTHRAHEFGSICQEVLA